jgi:hypothetical protein
MLFNATSGMQLFMLYKATQTVIEKAPIDAVTGNSRNTLAEERLLKHRVEYETMVKIRISQCICIYVDHYVVPTPLICWE